MPQTYHRQILDHWGLVAGMFEARGIAEGIDHATTQAPERRRVTAGHAVQAMVLNGWGFVNHQRSLGPHFFQNPPPSQRIAPAMKARHLNDDTLGRARDTLYDCGVTALYSLIAATAAQRWGLAPTFAHLESTSFQVDGRSNSDEPPNAPVIHIPQGSSRAPRPDLHPGMLALIVEPQAGMPGLMHPRSGHSSDATACGQLVSEHMPQCRTTDGTPSLGADRALSQADNLQKLSATHVPWSPRVPAALRAAQVALAQVAPQVMSPLREGARWRNLTSTEGGVEQRGGLLYSEPRQTQAQHTVDKQRLKQRTKAAQAFQHLGGTAWAWAAEAPPTLATLPHSLPATYVQESTVRPTAHYGRRGRPGQGAPPGPVVDHLEGALASRFAARQALVDQQSGFLLATNALDDTQ